MIHHCVHLSKSVHVCVYSNCTCVCVYSNCTCVCVCASSVHACMHTCVCIEGVCESLSVFVCERERERVCVCVCVCVCVYVHELDCAYVCIFIPLSFDLRPSRIHVDKLCYAWRGMPLLMQKNVPLCTLQGGRQTNITFIYIM